MMQLLSMHFLSMMQLRVWLVLKGKSYPEYGRGNIFYVSEKKVKGGFQFAHKFWGPGYRGMLTALGWCKSGREQKAVSEQTVGESELQSFVKALETGSICCMYLTVKEKTV